MMGCSKVVFGACLLALGAGPGAGVARAAGPGEACGSPGDCDSGVCVAEVCRAAACGDGLVNGDEACDDGALDANGQPALAVAGDGCSTQCAIEDGWLCTIETQTGASRCRPECGDGVVVAPEGCDDGDGAGLGVADRDGCSAACAVEPGWSCTEGADGSVCTAQCGDGAWADGAEGCDDGDTAGGDGCSADCAEESGWRCVGAPGEASVCTPRCGDGVLDVGLEECDDGKRSGPGGADLGDGCTDACEVEPGWSCDGGAPSVCDDDPDGDGVRGARDNCPEVSNSDQANADHDPDGNACDDDDDDDGVLDAEDDCPRVPNPDQADGDGDGVGDACEDGDQDEIPDRLDNCPQAVNGDQQDADGDGLGDACDDSPNGPADSGCAGGAAPLGGGLVVLAAACLRYLRRRTAQIKGS